MDVSAEKLSAIETLWNSTTTGALTSDHPAQGLPVELAYRRIEHTAPRGVVVISSGRTESLLKYDETVYDLHSAGYSVFIHDHRGQGLSGSTTGTPCDDVVGHGPGHVERFEHFVDDLERFVDAVVRPALGDSAAPLFLLGHSMGGAIVTRYLQRQPAGISAAVLCAPMHQPQLPQPAWVIATYVRAQCLLGKGRHYASGGGPYVDPAPFDEVADKRVDAYTHSGQRYARITALYERYPKARVGSASFRWVKEAIAAARQCRRDAARVDVPVLLLQATEDAAVHPDGQAEFCKRMNAGRGNLCRLLPIKGGYHELLVESDTYRDEAMTALLAFLETQTR